MSQKINTGVGAMILIVISLTVGVFVWKYYQLSPIPESNNLIQGLGKKELVACTMEAKLCPDGSYVSRSGPNCEFAVCPDIVGIKDKIIISLPQSDQRISSPFSIYGQAIGSWFFEGSFPVEVYDSKNKLLGSGLADFAPKNENDTWMTSDFVDFRGNINFSQPNVESGYLLFKKDNPSGNPEMNELFKLPINFSQKTSTTNWKTYRNTKYGFEFNYPSTFGILIDKIKSSYPSLPDWYVIELGDEKNEAQPNIYVDINPDGYGPGFPDRELVVDESSEGKLIIKSESSAILPDPDYEDGVFRYTTNIRSKNGNYYQIFFTANEGPDDYYQLFKQILSTFKFTN